MNDRFEISRTGVVVAYDADTGEPLLVNEIFEEIIPDQTTNGKTPTDIDSRSLEAEARRSYASRNIDVIAASNSDLLVPEGVLVDWRVDLQSRKLVQMKRPDRFAKRS